MKIISIFLVWAAAVVHNGGAARILALLGMPAPSHHVVLRILLEEMARRGHDIVSMTVNPVPYDNNLFNGTFKVIDVKNVSYSLWLQNVNRTNFYSRYFGNYKMYYSHISMLPLLVDVQMEEPKIKHILENQYEAFDLVITHNVMPIYFVAAARFKTPLISFACGISFKYNYESIGVPTQPLFYTSFMNKNLLKINFLTKLDILSRNFWMDLMSQFWSLDHNKSAKKHFGSNVPTIQDMWKKVSLSLSSAHPEIHGIRPCVPSLVHAGGIHLKSSEELPSELKQYMDHSSNGVIYMSFGTITKSSSFSPDVIKMFNKVFSRLPYNVVWKWDADEFPEKSPNILLVKWISQQDLLGHPNMKAFITHCGLFSLDESIYKQVPIIGIPFVADQRRNAEVAEALGIGLALDYSSLTEDILYSAIIKVAKDSSFRKNIKSLSLIVHDQPQTGLERAVWWLEYVLRHNGTEHLQAPIMDYYQYLMLDIVAFILVTVLALVLLVYKMIKMIFYRKNK